MRTTILLVAGAALMFGPSHGLADDAWSEDGTRCDVSNPDGSCRQAASMSEDRASLDAGAGSGEPEELTVTSNMTPGNDGTAGGP